MKILRLRLKFSGFPPPWSVAANAGLVQWVVPWLLTPSAVIELVSQGGDILNSSQRTPEAPKK